MHDCICGRHNICCCRTRSCKLLGDTLLVSLSLKCLKVTKNEHGVGGEVVSEEDNRAISMALVR